MCRKICCKDSRAERIQLLSSQHPKVSLSEFLGNSRPAAVCHVFLIYILRNQSASACKRQRALLVIINLFRPNERSSARRNGSHRAQR